MMLHLRIFSPSSSIAWYHVFVLATIIWSEGEGQGNSGVSESTLESKQRDILTQFYSSTNGANWANHKGWLEDEVSVCDWFGITCNTETEIISIDLENNSLDGPCPPSIFELSSLNLFNLRNNSIDISFSSIGNATNLQTLILSNSNLWRLDGIGSAPSLKSLHLTNNALVGTLPDEIYQLTYLEELLLNYNNFTGSLSTRIGQLKHLQLLYMYQNELSGEIPSDIGQLDKLKELALGDNHFTGTLPTELMKLSNLSILALERYEKKPSLGFHGPLPDFATFSNLRELQLGGNHFTGTIPNTFLAESSFKSSNSDVLIIGLSDNELSGTVPSSLAQFENLFISLAGNRITDIDQSLCKKSSWMNGDVAKFGCDAILCPAGTYSTFGRMTAEFNKCFPCKNSSLSLPFMGSTKCALSQQKILSYFWEKTGSTNWLNYEGWENVTSDTMCTLHGITCEFDDEALPTTSSAEHGKVVLIEVPFNGLSGLIPSEIYLLPYLSKLDIRDNQVGLSFSGIHNAMVLNYLDLSNTSLSSFDGISNATSLTELHATNVPLDGKFQEIFQLTNLQHLSLSFNNFESTLPGSIKGLKNLEHFDCYNCGLFGAIPGLDLLQLSKLRVLSLGENAFSGSFPVVLYQLPSLETLVINGNPITFSFEGISNAKKLKELYVSNLGISTLTGLSEAPSLESLHLTDNSITGPFPTELFSLKTLKQLLMNYNLITGTIPSDIQKLANLEELYLYGNRITGPIPKEIGYLTNLTSLVLSENLLTGTLPTELNMLSKLVVLSLHRSIRVGPGIKGPLLSLDQLSNIQELYFGGNEISGTIPNNFLNSAPVDMELYVELSDNRITGTLPSSLTKIESLSLLLTGNKIAGIHNDICSKKSWMRGDVANFGCDAILCPPGTYSELGRQSSPETTCDSCGSNTFAPYYGSTACYRENGEMVLTERQILENFYREAGGSNWKFSENWLSDRLEHCSWHGVNCTTIDGSPHVTSIQLEGNQLSGVISSYIFFIPHLKVLNLNSNDIIVSFGYAAQPSVLEELYLSNTLISNITGIGALGNLTVLNVADSYVFDLPSEVFLLDSLAELDISHNNLKGTLPSEIGNLHNLVSLRAYGNSFSGQIPSSIGRLVKLIRLDLAENDFTGTLPSQLNSLIDLQLLNLHQWTNDHKGIGGTVLDFAGLVNLRELYLDSNSLNGTIPASLLSRSKQTASPIFIGLASNLLEGTLPSELSRFAVLNIDVTGNKLTGIAPELCAMGDWMDNTVEEFGCDALLCPSGQFNDYGRQATTESPCHVCTDPIGAPFYGSVTCGGDQLGLSQVQIMEKFYYYTGGPNWVNQSNWLKDDLSVCNWYGVECNVAGEVTSISLESNQVSGTPHSSIFTLPALQKLDLRYNPIKFNFSGIGAATQLTSLFLSGTGISSLDGIKNASSLKSLHLTDNALSTIPDEIFELMELEQIFLDYNRLSGRLPKKISALKNLKDLYMFSNMLTGQIPAEIGQLTNLRTLVLSQNLLTGTIPKSFDRLLKLKFLALQQKSNAGIGGRLPTFSKLINLTAIYLGPNRLTGTIPASFLSGIRDLTQAVEIDLSFNLLSGTVPRELSRFYSLDIHLEGNKLTDIDSELCNKTQWNQGLVGKLGCSAILCPLQHYNELGRAIDHSPCLACSGTDVAPFLGSVKCLSAADVNAQIERQILQKIYKELDGSNWLQALNWNDPTVSICEWYGITCSTNGTVESVYLVDNSLSGKLSEDIFRLPSIKYINLSGNNIEIEDFQGIRWAQNLQQLNLDGNFVYSFDGISASKSLFALGVSSSGLKGPMPDELVLLSRLEELDVSENLISGELPSGLRLFENLTMFSASNNQLSGYIPPWISAWTKLKYLRLEGNDFSGAIPGALSSLPTLVYLDLSNQTYYGGGGLTGPLPDFSSQTLAYLRLQSNSLSGTIPSSLLSNIDVNSFIEIDLRSNKISGGLPSDFSRFNRLSIYLSENAITSIPFSLCQSKTQWMQGNVKQYGCDAILCPPQTFNDIGYRHSLASGCEPCSQHTIAPFYGSTKCAVTPRGILSLLYLSTNGQNWKRSTYWMTNHTICNWYGITCDSLSRSDRFELVTRVELGSNGLWGTVPTEIFQLQALEILDLSNNKIDLKFHDIGQATRLDVLNLNATEITSLEEIGQARGLSQLNLQNNDFQGSTIPSELYNVFGLETLLLSGSKLSGSIARQVGYLTSLRQLQISRNQITGSIPSEIGWLKNLKILDLSENDITGTLPSALNKLTSLIEFHMSCFTRPEGCISGNLPRFSELSSLKLLNLGGNNIAGSIPYDFLQSSSKVQKVTLTSNKLTGTIPSSLSTFTELVIDVTDNKIEAISPKLCAMSDWMGGKVHSYGCDAILCPIGKFNLHGRQVSDAQPCVECSSFKVSEYMGSVQCTLSPSKSLERSTLENLYNSCGGPEWYKKKNWMSPDKDICEWEGVSCRHKKSVEALLLGANNLVGTIPTEIFKMPSLEWLWLYSNPIQVPFSTISNATKLKSLIVDSTGLSSLDGIQNVRNLAELSVRFNSLTTLPTELAQLNDLESLSLADNKLSGTLPLWLQDFPRLRKLRLSSNRLSGPLLPFAQSSQLVSIDLSYNKINGTIPNELLKKSSKLEGVYLDFSHNELSGTVPSSFSRFSDLTLYLSDNRLTSVAESLCTMKEWNGGSVGNFGCNALLCPVGTFNGLGRQSNHSIPCEKCEINEYSGSSVCSSGRKMSRLNIKIISISIAASLLLCGML